MVEQKAISRSSASAAFRLIETIKVWFYVRGNEKIKWRRCTLKCPTSLFAF